MSKKIIRWSFVLFALLLVNCKKEASYYADTYIGTLSSQDARRDNIELSFEADDSDGNMLSFSGYALKEGENNQYLIEDKNAILKIVNMLYPDITVDMLYGTDAVFVFEKKELTMELHYGLLSNSNSENRNTIHFIGERK